MMLYAGFLWRAEYLWHDDPVLFSRAVERFPDCPLYRRKLADELLKRGDAEGAARQLVYAYKVAPSDYKSQSRLVMLYKTVQGRTDMRAG